MARGTVLGVIIGVAVLLAAGCGGSSGETGDATGSTRKAYAPRVDPADFTTTIDNEYFPLEPGTTFVYEKRGEKAERDEVAVTHDTRRVMGVECVVVRDTATEGGELIERTFDWYAQDEKGTVWYFGEDTKEYRNGKVVSTGGSWEAGVDGARPGIIMQADPKPGLSYRQEYYEGEAEDKAEVVSVNESATVPYGSFDHVLITKEWTPLEPGLVEHKYYAPGVGQVGASEGLNLVDVKTG
ncbi:hypothetical protein [Rubrobacter tropicus]|nr:hypothetical protein [Rubrobacter tropicus]